MGGDHGEQKLITKLLDFIRSKNITFEAITTTNRNWQSITYCHRRGQPLVASASIFEAWLRELVRYRNRYAHGGHAAQGAWVWEQWEHLLLSSFIFPLILKLYISQFDTSVTYTISDDDLKLIRMIEKMLAAKDYYDMNQNDGTTPWGELISEAQWLD
ncbi:MAG: hypothetical protein WC694_03615 [Candidatus Paceibacterota bacterium]